MARPPCVLGPITDRGPCVVDTDFSVLTERERGCDHSWRYWQFRLYRRMAMRQCRKCLKVEREDAHG